MKAEYEINSIPRNFKEANIPDPCIMIIFGASGDLTKRMLIPSLFKLYSDKLLPQGFVVVGFSRKAMEEYNFRESMNEAVNN